MELDPFELFKRLSELGGAAIPEAEAINPEIARSITSPSGGQDLSAPGAPGFRPPDNVTGDFPKAIPISGPLAVPGMPKSQERPGFNTLGQQPPVPTANPMEPPANFNDRFSPMNIQPPSGKPVQTESFRRPDELNVPMPGSSGMPGAPVGAPPSPGSAIPPGFGNGVPMPARPSTVPPGGAPAGPQQSWIAKLLGINPAAAQSQNPYQTLANPLPAVGPRGKMLGMNPQQVNDLMRTVGAGMSATGKAFPKTGGGAFAAGFGGAASAATLSPKDRLAAANNAVARMLEAQKTGSKVAYDKARTDYYTAITGPKQAEIAAKAAYWPKLGDARADNLSRTASARERTADAAEKRADAYTKGVEARGKYYDRRAATGERNADTRRYRAENPGSNAGSPRKTAIEVEKLISKYNADEIKEINAIRNEIGSPEDKKRKIAEAQKKWATMKDQARRRIEAAPDRVGPSGRSSNKITAEQARKAPVVNSAEEYKNLPPNTVYRNGQTGKLQRTPPAANVPPQYSSPYRDTDELEDDDDEE